MLYLIGALPYDELLLLPTHIASMQLPSVALSTDFNSTDTQSFI